MIEYWIEDKIDYFNNQKETSHTACGICDVLLCYPRCWSVEFLMQITGSGSSTAWHVHALYTLHWSQSCLIDMFYQYLKMPGLWYEFNDTEHDNKACQRCIDKKLCLVFTPLCWHESALEITSSWWLLKWWWPTRIKNSHFDPCGMQFKLSKGCGGQLERQCCTCRLLPMYITPPQSFDNMLRRNIYNLHRCVAPLWFLSWQVNKL